MSNREIGPIEMLSFHSMMDVTFKPVEWVRIVRSSLRMIARYICNSQVTINARFTNRIILAFGLNAIILAQKF